MDRLSVQRVDDILFEVVHVDFTLQNHAPAHRNAGADHAGRVAGNQRVPVRQILALGLQAVGAGLGHPVELLHQVGVEREAGGHQHRALGVASAARGVAIEQLAGDVGVEDLFGVFILKLEQAAAPAAVAQRLPLLARHLGEGFCFPEGGHGVIIRRKEVFGNR